MNKDDSSLLGTTILAVTIQAARKVDKSFGIEKTHNPIFFVNTLFRLVFAAITVSVNISFGKGAQKKGKKANKC